MSAHAPALRLAEVLLPETAGRGPMAPLSLDLAPGTLALVEAPDPAWFPALGDLVCGLVAPAAGAIEFEGRPWSGAAPGEQAAMRARIGRVFSGAAWISNLDVDENVILAQLYHTDRPGADLRAAAEELARRFGLAGIPAGRPAFANPRDLQAAQWVRAWLGRPALFVLEAPEAAVPARSAGLFRAALREALAAGAAAVWIAERGDPALEVEVGPVVRLAIGGPAAAG